ncbi:MAG: TRAP transporter small permease [Gammaproteobacteria bacterium]|nr:TRAP transporter small permease [Gammaproteobacteria bacterium]
MLGSMILLASTQILLRNLFDTGIFWGDSLLRIMVLWIALIGATVATRSNNHIRIDLISRMLPPLAQRIAATVTFLFTSTVCITTAHYSLEFIRFEYEDQTLAFAQVPAWICQSILPVAFSLMGLRFLLQGLMSVLGKEIPQGGL